MMLLGYALTADPDYASYFIPGGSNNFPHADDPKLTDMLVKAAAMTSADERKATYAEIQKYMRDGQFVTSLYQQEDVIAQSKSLKGGTKPFWEGSLDDIVTWTLE